MYTIKFNKLGPLDHFVWARKEGGYARLMTKIDERMSTETGELYNALDGYGNIYYFEDDAEVQTPFDYESQMMAACVKKYKAQLASRYKEGFCNV